MQEYNCCHSYREDILKVHIKNVKTAPDIDLHAMALQKNTQPVQKITIVPRTMGALGYTMQMPEKEEKYLNNKNELLDQITVFLAGRAAEEIVFDTQTTGASNDNRDALDEISEFLIEKETITGDEFMEILDKVKNAKEPQIQADETEEI